MKGKVFESSMDVYQDQASVLFDFYLNAAQKIIDQEDAWIISVASWKMRLRESKPKRST